MPSHREQVLGGVQACLDTKLVGRDAEDGLELPDEMKRRNLHLAREVRYRRLELARFPQEIASPAQAPEPFVSQQHRSRPSVLVAVRLNT
jgi:hypothetical protein